MEGLTLKQVGKHWDKMSLLRISRQQLFLKDLICKNIKTQNKWNPDIKFSLVWFKVACSSSDL